MLSKQHAEDLQLMPFMWSRVRDRADWGNFTHTCIRRPLRANKVLDRMICRHRTMPAGGFGAGCGQRGASGLLPGGAQHCTALGGHPPPGGSPTHFTPPSAACPVPFTSELHSNLAAERSVFGVPDGLIIIYKQVQLRCFVEVKAAGLKPLRLL